MYELAKSSREAMKSKARRLAGEKDQKVDSSNWSPAPPLNADKKTGLQPTSGARNFNKGGKVAGAPCGFRADRKPRKAGGRVEKQTGGSLPKPEEAMQSEARMKNVKVEDTRKLPPPQEAAKSAARTGDVPARKCGGRAKKNLGGVMQILSPAYAAIRALQRNGKDEEYDAAEQAKGMAMANAMRKRGGKVAKAKDGDKDDRPARASGGRTKGKTNISINILAGGKPPMMAAPMTDAGPAPGAPIPTPAPAPAAPPPAVMPMPMPMASGQPPMPRKRGGRVSSYKDMDAGAGSGDGRLEKTEIQQKKRRA